MIVHKQNKWLVMDSSGKKILGTHYSKKDAADQLAAIEISKKRKKQIEETPNLLNNSMNNLTEYYKKLCEDLMGQRMVLEAKIKEEKHKKKHKKHAKDDKSDKANKDYDGDGQVESNSEEYLGSRSNAIKKAISKREGKDLKEDFDDLIDGRYDPELGRVVTRHDRRKGMDVGVPSIIQVDSPFYGVDRSKQKFNQKNPSSSDSDLDAMRKKAEEIGGIPMPDKSSSDIINMRKKAAEMGGITDDMINEPIPSSSGSSISPNVSDYQPYKRLRSRINYDDREYPVRIEKKSIRDVAQDLLNSFKNDSPKYGDINKNYFNKDEPSVKDFLKQPIPNLGNDLKKKVPDYKLIPKDKRVLYAGLKTGLMGESLDYIVNPDKSKVNEVIKKLNKGKN
jgi:hypothetical protein